MPETSAGFSWRFLEEMSTWTLGFGLLIAIAGGFILGNPLFLAAVLAGVLADVAIVRTTAHRGMRDETEHVVNPALAGLFVGVRLVVKAAILVIGYLAPNPEVFWGAVIGVVLFDTVLLIVGSVRAASSMREAKER
jgi:hypothetical protein